MLEWNAGTNIATQAAHDLLKPFNEKRHAVCIPKNNWNNYLYCQKCRMNNNKTKYHKDEMFHYKREYRKNGRLYTAYTHYCEECNETYVPQSERIGTMNE